MFKVNLEDPNFFEIVKSYFDSIFIDQIFIDVRDNSLIKYKEITYQNYNFILGDFLKIEKFMSNQYRIYQDLMGNLNYAYKFSDGQLIFDKEFSLYQNESENNKKKTISFIKKNKYVKGNSTIYSDIYRFLGLSEILINFSNIYEEPISIEKINELFSLKGNYLKSISYYLNNIGKYSILFSGGSDSKLLDEITNPSNLEERFFGFLDQKYESSNVDFNNIKKYKRHVNVISLEDNKVIDFIFSDNYLNLKLNFKGYSHVLYNFYLIFKNFRVSNNNIITGQGADTIGFFGPSEKFYLNNFFPRNLRPLISRIRIISLILFCKDYKKLYWFFYNDYNYRFCNKNISIPENKFLEKVLLQISNLELQNIDKKIFLCAIAKLRGFGSGNDIRVMQYLSKVFKLNIKFPLNNIFFGIESWKNLKRRPLYYIFFPKFWYGNISYKIFENRINHKNKHYEDTLTYKAYVKFKNNL